jgi:ferric-chelate reductase
MPAGLSYNPLSIMFINVPNISKLQWHPFTITSNSNLEAEKISIVVKGVGSWSKKLYQLLSSPSSADRLEVSVEGPYGPVSTDFLRFARKENVCLSIHSSLMMFQILINDCFCMQL